MLENSNCFNRKQTSSCPEVGGESKKEWEAGIIKGHEKTFVGDGYIILPMMMVPEMYTCQNLFNFILYICAIYCRAIML